MAVKVILTFNKRAVTGNSSAVGLEDDTVRPSPSVALQLPLPVKVSPLTVEAWGCGSLILILAALLQVRVAAAVVSVVQLPAACSRTPGSVGTTLQAARTVPSNKTSPSPT